MISPYIFLFVLALYLHNDMVQLNNLYLVACLVAILTNRRYINIVTLALLLFIFKLIEVTLLKVWLEDVNTYLLYFSYAFVNFLLAFLISLRPAWCRLVWVLVGKIVSDNTFFLTRADMVLAFIHFMNALVNCLMLIEHLLRHPEHIGLSKNAWLYEHARLIYHFSDYFNLVSAMVEVYVVVASVGFYLKERRVIDA